MEGGSLITFSILGALITYFFIPQYGANELEDEGNYIPLEFEILEPKDIQVKAVFNAPPEITSINSGRSVLSSGTSTNVFATIVDPEGKNISWRWSIDTINGACETSELGTPRAGISPNGTTISIPYTPETLNNKCIIKLRVEDVHGADALGEVYLYVQNVNLFWPPYAITKIQTATSAYASETVRLGLEICDPEQQAVTIDWSSDCSALSSETEEIIDMSSCQWVETNSVPSSVPCTVNWKATDTSNSIATGNFRIAAKSRRLRQTTGIMPTVVVITEKNQVITKMLWPKEASATKPTGEIKEANNDSEWAVPLSITLLGLIIFSGSCLFLYNVRKKRVCVKPISKKSVKIQKSTGEKKIEEKKKGEKKPVQKKQMKHSSSSTRNFRKDIISDKKTELLPVSNKKKMQVDIPVISEEQMKAGFKRQRKERRLKMQQKWHNNIKQQKINRHMVDESELERTTKDHQHH